MERVYAELGHLLLDDVEETGKELGRGAYGVVYEVKVSGLLCAGKRIHDILVDLEEECSVKKFVDECLLHSNLRHPNIVQLMGVYINRKRASHLPVLVMEYLPLSLAKCLDTKGNLSLQIKYSILLNVARGINFLHHKKPAPIVHRDVSSYNILLTSTFVAKLSDLGVSRMIDNKKNKSLTLVPGNPAVMPPESLRYNPQYDCKLDVFSYGCLILHVFTQIWPAPRPQSSTVHISEWDRRSACTHIMGDHHPMLATAKNCLEDNPSKRPDMKTIVQSLDDIMASLPLESMEEEEMVHLYDYILNDRTSENKSQSFRDDDEYDYPLIDSLLPFQAKQLSETARSLKHILSPPPPPLPQRNWQSAKVKNYSPDSSPILKRRAQSQKNSKINHYSRSAISNYDDINELPASSFRPRYPGTPPIAHRKHFSKQFSTGFTESFPPLPPPRPPKPMTPTLSHKPFLLSSPPKPSSSRRPLPSPLQSPPPRPLPSLQSPPSRPHLPSPLQSPPPRPLPSLQFPPSRPPLRPPLPSPSSPLQQSSPSSPSSRPPLPTPHSSLPSLPQPPLRPSLQSSSPPSPRHPLPSPSSPSLSPPPVPSRTIPLPSHLDEVSNISKNVDSSSKVTRSAKFPAVKRSWYYASLSKESAETILFKHGKINGNFLIRINSMKVCYLSVYFSRTVVHIKICKNEDGSYSLDPDNGQTEFFISLDQIVKYFQNNLLLLEGVGATYLSEIY